MIKKEKDSNKGLITDVLRDLIVKEEGGGEYSFYDIYRKSCDIAFKLENLGLQGERVLMLNLNFFDFIVSFLGALYAKVEITIVKEAENKEFLSAAIDEFTPKAVLSASYINESFDEFFNFTQIKDYYHLEVDSFSVDTDGKEYSDIDTNEVILHYLKNSSAVQSYKYSQILELLSLFIEKDSSDIVEIFQEILFLCNREKKSSRDVKNVSNKIYPLSAQQMGLWVNYKLKPDSEEYAVYSCFQIKGSLDIPRFEKAIKAIYNYFPILRTKFSELKSGEVLQEILAEENRENLLSFDDFSEQDITKQERKEKLESLTHYYKFTPFNLEKEQVSRFALIKSDKDEYLFVGVFHHIICDGIGGIAVGKLLSEFYNEGEEGVLQRLGRKEDYDVGIYLQEDGLEKTVKLEAQEYWKNRLKNINFSVDILGKRHSEIVMDSAKFSFGAERYARLKKYAKSNRSTVFLVLSAIYGLSLSRIFAKNDFALSYPVDTRNKILKNSAGYYVSLYPLIMSIDDGESFAEFVKRLTAEQKKDRKHYGLSFSEILECFVDKEINKQISFSFGQTMFVNKDVEMEGLDVEVSFDFGIEEGELDFLFDPRTEELDSKISYNKNLFDAEQIQLFFVRLCKIVDFIIEDKEDIPLKDIDILSNAEQQKLLYDLNDTACDFGNSSILDLFSEQAHKRSDSIAVSCESQDDLSYADLDARSEELAILLQEKGACADMLIAICMERKIEMVIAILAILKSGAAYVPLDPEAPKDRLKFILEDTASKIVLTSEGTKNVIDDLALSIDNIVLGEISEGDLLVNGLSIVSEYGFESSKVLDKSGRSLSDLAYVIYTSGSTGIPKGVMIEHRSLSNYILYNQDIFTSNEEGGDNFGWLLSYVFDGSIQNLFVSLTTGNRLFIFPQINSISIEHFIALVINNNIHVMDGSPHHLEMVLDHLHSDIKIKKWFLIGEILPSAAVNKLIGMVADISVYNCYGPTECTVGTTLYEVNQNNIVDFIDASRSLPIGKVISNMQCYILDKNLHLVPRGSVGELFISGAGVARGYLNREELTKEKFIENPFISEERMYRSGDLVKYLSDGNIEYIGRIDDQVKIRGFRIELGEIEANALDSELVRNVVVLVKERKGNKFLVCYYVNETDAADELRVILADKLPYYMIPNVFVRLENMPLNSNGKADKKYLKGLEVEFSSGEEFVEATTELELSLRKMWSEVLNIEEGEIGIGSSFFHLGGNSILAMKLVALINQELKLNISLRQLLDNATIKSLSLLDVSANVQIISLEKNVYDNRVIASNNQEGLFFLHKVGNNCAYNVASYIDIIGVIDLDLFRQSFIEVVKRHQILRTSFIEDDGVIEQNIYDIKDLDLDELFKVKNFSDIEAIESYVEKDAKKGFDLEKFPLFKAEILLTENGCDYSVFYLNIHHIIFDGWSVGILLDELSLLYSALLKKEENPLLDLEFQYADFSLWQGKYLKSTIYTESLSWWKKYLQGSSFNLNLLKNLKKANLLNSHSSQGFVIDRELFLQIEKLAKECGVSVFVIMLSSLYLLLSHYSSGEDVAIGVPYANRDSVEIQNMIGYFVNSLIYRINIEQKDFSIKKLLEYVQNMHNEILLHKDVPFSKIVQEISPERGNGSAPLIEVMLAYQNFPEPELNIDDLKIRVNQLENQQAKFDLSFDVNVFQVRGEDADVSFAIEYNANIYHKEDIYNIGCAFKRILSFFSSDKQNIELKDIDVLSNAEQQRLLYDFNDTACDFGDSSILDLFSEQVENRGDSIALSCEGQDDFSYTDLDVRSEELAILLQEKGACADMLIAVCMERKIEMVVAILAILKSGAAYVPLDSEAPKDRLKFILEDTASKIIVTSESTKDVIDDLDLPIDNVVLGEVSGGDLLVNGTSIVSEYGFESGQVLEKSGRSLSDLAYVIYTSGSTGIPKGVMIEHRSLSNLIFSLNKKLELSGDNLKFAWWSNYIFDASIQLLFLSLFKGVNLFIMPLINKVGKNNVLSLFIDNEFDLIDGTPHHLELLKSLLLDEKTSKFNFPQKCLIGGEGLKVSLVKDFFDWIRSNIEIYNAYGPTECTVDSSLFMINKDNIDCLENNDFSIGKPIENTQYFILNKNLNLVPQGVVGRIMYIWSWSC